MRSETLELPPNTTVHACERYGFSKWTVRNTLVEFEPDYTKQCADGEQGKMMLDGEFHSMTELYKTMPSFVQKPYCSGKLPEHTPERYFFLCDFIQMTNEGPDPIQPTSTLVELHQSSDGEVRVSHQYLPGKPSPGCQWNDTWQGFYIQLVKGALKMYRERNGNWKNLEQLVDRLITHVVPQLLGPLESDGRTVKPTLTHGDLWDGNIGTSAETGDIYIFDANAYYAHNEMEIAMWRARFNKVVSGQVYLGSYLKRTGKSEPAEQFEERSILYSIYMTLHESACHYGADFREECYENLNRLIDKYAPYANRKT
ncbi:hypothetical protein M501DRAFT_1011535 [Patellaria atrata CBS 101060]|uniref:protein-ribulosamine 3-kinase n=1 Tax=Patellaria atrata CBS 101060 TaxID=1346257 RepID=A0A9P4SA58_9PEZI|nr:hypothetical protein M501DRAFT_1011535 [Patellaria atrata CBS 101060]